MRIVVAVEPDTESAVFETMSAVLSGVKGFSSSSFSRTTIVLSNTIPVPITRAISDIMFIEIPAKNMNVKTIKRDAGSDAITMADIFLFLKI